MPLLDEEQQRTLLGPMPEAWRCGKCHKLPVRNYCRSCDEFFFVCDCPPEPGQSGLDHVTSGCRTY